MSKLYMAYGSNLNKQQMSERCPTARAVGSAMIYGHELVFRGVADIAKSNASMYIPVGIWEIEESDERALDIYEGVSGGLYKQMKIAGIMTYKMNSKQIARPTSYYFNTILEGYHDFGLDTSLLYDAAGWAEYEERQHNNVFGLEIA